MDLEGIIEKVQESSPVLMQARDLPGGPRRYYRKSAGKYRKSAGMFTCTDAGYVTCCQKSSDLVQEM